MIETREQRLAAQLEYLKLPHVRENHAEAAKIAARKNLPHFDFLAELVEGETNRRRENALKGRLRKARLPYPKSLDQFRWSHPDKINRQQIENLFRLNFVERRENVVLLGGCGLGKTHIAVALATAACERGYATLFTDAADIVNTLAAARAANALEKALKRYTSPKLLIIDELGYLPIDKLGADLMFQVISKRYERGSIVITCNRPFKKWAQIFNNDSVVASAILDRVLHHCEPVLIEGKSYRMKDKAD